MRHFFFYIGLLIFVSFSGCGSSPVVDNVMERMRGYNFEHNSGYDGVGDINDKAWEVRMLAIRDILREGKAGAGSLIGYLDDDNRHVRQVAAFTLGLLDARQATGKLATLLYDDPDRIVRGQAAEALGRFGGEAARKALEPVAEADTVRDVRHRARLAVTALNFDRPGYEAHTEAFRSLDETRFELVEVGKPAPPFVMRDTKGKTWTLDESLRENDWLVLIWIFADWCPVCQHEFNDLQELEEQYRTENVQVMTIECRERYRCDAMVAGRDLWWPHMVDNGGAVGATYGVDPMTFWVHNEWVNRPSTVIIDKSGIVRFAYYGTFWGDRPTIDETLEFIRTENFEFEHPKRRK